MATIDASRLLGPGGWTGPVRVHLEQGTIRDIVPLTFVRGGATDRTLVPGFVDLQVNGVDSIHVATAEGADWDRLDRHLVAHGVTAWCPTLVSAPLHRYTEPLARIELAMHRAGAPRPRIVGAHLEGPFLGRAPGAHRRSDIIDIDLGWLAALPGHVAVVTLAAEQPLAPAATRLLTDRGVLVAIGHTTASAEEFHRTTAAGARLVTHLFNAMTGLHHRVPGVAAFALLPDPGSPAPSATIIADGVHVDPRMLRLAFEVLGTRVVLVSDAVAWRKEAHGLPGDERPQGAARLPDGTLAGSVIALDDALRTCVAAGIPLEHACRAASTEPARLLGLPLQHGLRAGSPADLVALDGQLAVAETWIDGLPTRHT